MNEEQKFKVGDLVKLEGWDYYRPVASIKDGYLYFVNTEGMQWYDTFKYKFIKYGEKENEMQNTESKKDMQEKKTEDNFKVGDVVWCVIYGKGVVKNIVGQYTTYPVIIDFENGVHLVTYTHDGKVSSSAQRTLFFSEPKIEALTTRPFTPTLIGKRVMIVTDNRSFYSFEVSNECKFTLSDKIQQSYCKSGIEELYILGENVVNSIK